MDDSHVAPCVYILRQVPHHVRQETPLNSIASPHSLATRSEPAPSLSVCQYLPLTQCGCSQYFRCFIFCPMLSAVFRVPFHIVYFIYIYRFCNVPTKIFYTANKEIRFMFPLFYHVLINIFIFIFIYMLIQYVL